MRTAGWMMRRKKMQQTDIYINDQLSKAQALLWSGSLHEVDEAHNIIAKLINDRMGKSEGQNDSL
jgi:hypothetical protein